MSGRLKEVRIRIKSVVSTQQITKAMKMVSAAKLRKAQSAILQMRPYESKMSGLLSNLVAATEGDVNIDFANERDIKKVLIVAVTSDRGLCGAFNANVSKLVVKTIEDKYQAQYDSGNLKVMCVGKKSLDFFTRRPYDVDKRFVNLFGNLNFAEVREATEAIKQGFINKEWDVVEVVYNRFKNAATQMLEVDRFLPIQKPKVESTVNADFIYEPEKESIIEELVPKIMNTQFFRYMLDSHASEHGARMTAMDKATENADELLRDLRISYNRERQAAITTELTEIVSGAAALSSN